MLKKKRRVLLLALIAMAFTLFPSQLFAGNFKVESGRIFGVDRIETALEICSSGWDKADTVIIAPADQENLVDALAAAPLAGQENAPILLTYKNVLDSKVKAKIISLNPEYVYVIGAIQDNIRNEITAIGGISVVALKGSNRWETVKAINERLYNIEGCFIVGFNSLADALSVSSFAAANRYAIILADQNGRIPSGQGVLGTITYIVGGPALVSDISGSAVRLAGGDRFETNKIILENLYFNYTKVYLANGFDNHLVDSLIAASLAAKERSPIILTNNYLTDQLDAIKAKMYSYSEIIALGGAGVVSNTIRDSLGGANSGGSSGTAIVRDITPVSLNSFKVYFNNRIDKDTAETVSNYIVNGSELEAGFDSAALLADGKTVLVMIDQDNASDMAPFGQLQRYTVEIKKNLIFSEDKITSVPGYSKEIEFHDVTIPKISTVKAYGNKKVVVEFTEPVNVRSLSSNVYNWKIDGTNLSAYGLNSSGCDTIKPTFGTAFPISFAIELYFESPLSSGNHSLTIKDGTSGVSGWLVDGANFVFQESSMNFRVESYSGQPQVQSVTVVNNKIQVKFNRSMFYDANDPNNGRGSALNTSYYDVNDVGESSSLNSSPLSSNPVFKSNSEDTIVEFSVDSGVLKSGYNILEINKNIQDAWGNQLHSNDNLRLSFTYQADKTKPYVLSVVCLSDTKLRIHFSEDMNKDYAQNVSNYNIKNSDGVEIFGRSAGGTASTVPLNQDSNTVELVMPNNTYLNQSDYVLKIENLIDTAFESNTMDTYTITFNGYDDRGPQLKEVIVDSSDNSMAVCFFDEAVNSDSIRLINFGYKDGAGDSRDLPSGSSLSIDGTGKIVTVDFPSGYTVKVLNGGAGDTNDKYEVNGIRAAFIKDRAGNVMPGIAMTVNVQSSVSGDYQPHYIENSFYLYDDGDYVKAEIKLNQQLNNLNQNDFSIGENGVGYAGGILPDGAYSVGEKIYLRFTDNTKVRAVRKSGPNAFVYSKRNASLVSYGTSGVKLLEFPVAGYQVYDDQIKPRVLIDDPNTPTLKLTSTVGDAIVIIAFSEPIDGSIVGYYEDDFTFTCGGGTRSVKSVEVDTVDKRLVKYNLGPVADLSSNTITVRAVESKNSIRDLKDRGPQDNNIYVPTSDDRYGWSVSDNSTPTIAGVTADSATDKVRVTFSEAIFTPGSCSDFKIDSPYDEGITATTAATAWAWAADNTSVELTFGALNLKANDTYSLQFVSPGSSKYRDGGIHCLSSVTKSGFVNTSALDATAPTVCIPIGDALGNGETITTGSSVYVRFSEVLSTASKAAVETALTGAKSGAGTLTYVWDDTTAKLTATATGGNVIFAADVTCNISDGTNTSIGVTILND
ncbi:MAG: cell wall-binding repeat-containing protein [Peptococcaceae bacterium]|nr:cell wall-binding repeat-containing protein [Peptococcaceae bacterium]